MNSVRLAGRAMSCGEYCPTPTHPKIRSSRFGGESLLFPSQWGGKNLKISYMYIVTHPDDLKRKISCLFPTFLRARSGLDLTDDRPRNMLGSFDQIIDFGPFSVSNIIDHILNRMLRLLAVVPSIMTL